MKRIIRKISIEFTEIESKRDIRNKVVSRRCEYVIKINYWFKKSKYVRLLGEWEKVFSDKDYIVEIELVNRKRATFFKEEDSLYNPIVSKAWKIKSLMEKNPNRFIVC